MRKVGGLGCDKTSLAERLWGAVPSIGLPSIGRTVDVPVYVVHNSPDREDYFFIFDFEQFVDRSRTGMFVRPKLRVWAGRQDFNRIDFARQFRISFAREFDAARTALTAKGTAKRGWFNWDFGADLVSLSVAGFVANVVLLVGLSAGKMVWSALPVPAIFTAKSKAEKLEARIIETQTKVDQALALMEVTLHIDLYDHAYRGVVPDPLSGLDPDGWPLPDYVKSHLTQKTSSSWW